MKLLGTICGTTLCDDRRVIARILFDVPGGMPSARDRMSGVSEAMAFFVVSEDVAAKWPIGTVLKFDVDVASEVETEGVHQRDAARAERESKYTLGMPRAY